MTAITIAAMSGLRGSKARTLVLLALAELCGMSMWFSASAVVPTLQAEWGLAEHVSTWLTLAVQLGFVLGTLLSAVLNLPDVLNSRRLFALSAAAGALVNAAFAWCAQGPGLGIPLRFLTGFFLAGVYPPGMKILATWFRERRGMAIGVLIGALTLGQASPYFVSGLSHASWRSNMLITSGVAVLGGLIVLFLVSDGPYALANARFDLRQCARVLTNRGVRLATFGYLGHMWELYAMWTWTPAMIRQSFAAQSVDVSLGNVASFLVLGAGAAGCVTAGVAADRVGRTLVTSLAMGISGACCVVIGFLFGGSPALLLVVAAIWGASVVADSAQFSACVTELGDPQYIGTALTLQTCLGFLLTVASIKLIPALVAHVGWRYAFAALAPGPFLGVVAMLRLRSLPEATRIAQGRR
jgi:MFS family permease